MTIKKVNEGLGDMAHMAERDHEVQMARAELYKIAKYAIKLHEMLKGVSEAEGIEGWMQSKITKAADYIGSVYHTLEYDMISANDTQKFAGMSEEVKDEYKNTLAERMTQKKTKLGELSPDTLYKYHGKAYDDEADRRGSGDTSDENKRKIANRKKGRALAATKHNKAKGWTRPTGAKKDASDASKSAAALAKLMAKKDRQGAKAEESIDEAFQKGDIVKPTKGPHKGVPHEVIHDFGDGHYNVKPKGLNPKQIRYSMGAAKAHKSDLVKEVDESFSSEMNKASKKAKADAEEKRKKLGPVTSNTLKDINDKLGNNKKKVGEATDWEVSYDHGPHQSNTVSVKAKSKEEALDKAKQVAKDVHKHDRITSIAVSPKKNESLDEKAKSKAQQRFMGMVHATQKGEPAPSKEVAKVAKEMPKKAAKDYAATKHKGKPEHVKKK